MKAVFLSSTASLCPFEGCPSTLANAHYDPDSARPFRKGYYYRKSDGRRVTRYKCRSCGHSFSNATRSPCYWQKKRKQNEPVRRLFCSGVSQRRIAKLLRLNRKTVERKLIFLAAQARLSQQQFLDSRSERKFTDLQFDEMETSERSKCLPLSIPLMVEASTRRILGYRVCSMPAKGKLAAISLRKYGSRKDDRPAAAKSLFTELAPYIDLQAKILSDENPHYPRWIKRMFPSITHRTVKGRRGAVVGQGELKKIGFDPLFSLNHTCAMLRANINRLFRRTWCTTKRAQRLDDHIAIYIDYHNRELVRGS